MINALFLSYLALSPFQQDTDEAFFDPAAFGIATFEDLERLHERGFAGVLLVAVKGEVVFSEGFGLANRESGLPWSSSVLSTVGSISKQFTAACVMKLAEQKKLTTNDTLSRFFDDVPGDKAGITLHQLLTHSSGIGELDPMLRDDEWIGRDDFVESLFAQPLEASPGERYAYSNTGFTLLAIVVESVSERPFETFLREELLLPAGMLESGYVQPEYDRARIAFGYRGDETWGNMLDDMYFEDGPSWVLRGNGGAYCSADQMLRWVRALAEGRVLSQASVEAMWTPHVDESNGRRLSHYGYGWSVSKAPDGTTVIGHNGNDAGPTFFNDLAWLPEHQAFVFLQTNTYFLGDVEDIVHRAVARLAPRR